MIKGAHIRWTASGLLIVGLLSGQSKPVVALTDFINNTEIDLITKRGDDYRQTLAQQINATGKVAVRTEEDMDFINQLNELIQLGAVEEENPILELLNLPRDRFGALMAEGADYLGFGVWTANDNMIFQSASLSLTFFMVDVETRETITVSQAIDNDVLPVFGGRDPILDPPALDRADELLAKVAEEASYALTLDKTERELRYEIRQIENEAAGRRNGKKLTYIAAGMLAFTELIGAWGDFTFLQVLAFDGYAAVFYLGLRDIYLGRDARKRAERLKKVYRERYATEI